MRARRTGRGKGAARESNSFEKGAEASSIRDDSRSSMFFLERDIFFPIGKINEKRRKKTKLRETAKDSSSKIEEDRKVESKLLSC